MAAGLNWALEKMGWRVPEDELIEDDFAPVAEVHEYPFSAFEQTVQEEAPVKTSIERDSYLSESAAQDDRRRIVTVHPRSFSDARVVAESFRDGIPVIMNLTDMDDSEARRIIDFAAGLTFGLRGEIERVTTRVFLLSPEDTVVSNSRVGRTASYR
ncbi:cell division protein SepF [Scrofimicrobium sp. R131]|uniref:Cell division protein SepF n=1 Tax=Scrofimicrobium appendicitidis TaxID=3079930 RepID=A0AAU7V4Y2_9ACTO